MLERQYNVVCYAWKIMVCDEREDGRKNPALKTCIHLQGKDGIKQSRERAET